MGRAGAPRRPAGDLGQTRTAQTGIPALDGLRAIAVALVLVGHGGIPGVGGGFIGVDIFFVLCGFLITSLLLDELGRTGRIELTGFWIRRARRLLPALVLMVLTVAVARELLPDQSLTGLRSDALAAFLWMANWRFVAQKTDYFTQGAPPSPLQHTWSLGVEEQYYVLWPVLLIAVTLLLAARARRYFAKATVGGVRFATFLLATVGALASAAVAIVLVSDATRDRVYFGTDTRAQALLIGSAASALLVRDWPSLNRGWCLIRTRGGAADRPSSAVRRAGGAGGGGSLRNGQRRRVPPRPADRGRGRGRPGGRPRWRWSSAERSPAFWPGARWCGWAPFPMASTCGTGRSFWRSTANAPDGPGVPLFAARCAATVAVAAASWWLIEQPIRRWRPSRVPLLPLAAATVASAAAVTLLVVPVGTGPGLRERPAARCLGGRGGLAVAAGGSHPAGPRDPNRPFTVSVFGDSIGWTWMHYLPPTPGFAFLDHTVIGCSLVRGTPYRYIGQTLEQRPECDAWPLRWSTQISQDQPDVALLIIGRWETVDRVNEGKWTHIGDPTFDAYLNAELERALNIVGSTGVRVVVATVPYSRGGEKPDGRLYPEDQPDRVNQWNTMLRNTVGHHPNVQILDLNKKLCPDGVYTAKVDGIKVRSDGVHLTPEGVKWLTPWLEDSVRSR